MPQVHVHVTLPPPAPQARTHSHRIVSISVNGGAGQAVSIDSGVTEIEPFVADLAHAVQARVTEVLDNGKQSAPCVSPVATLLEHVEAVAADPSAFVFRVVPVPAATSNEAAK
jgi:hypothetical protein